MSTENFKRKTHTSSEVKRRYNEKTYTNLILAVKKETAAAYKAKCAAQGIPYSAPLHEAIRSFLEQ